MTSYIYVRSREVSHSATIFTDSANSKLMRNLLEDSISPFLTKGMAHERITGAHWSLSFAALAAFAAFSCLICAMRAVPSFAAFELAS